MVFGRFRNIDRRNARYLLRRHWGRVVGIERDLGGSNPVSLDFHGPSGPPVALGKDSLGPVLRLSKSASRYDDASIGKLA